MSDVSHGGDDVAFGSSGRIGLLLYVVLPHMRGNHAAGSYRMYIGASSRPHEYILHYFHLGRHYYLSKYEPFSTMDAQAFRQFKRDPQQLRVPSEPAVHPTSEKNKIRTHDNHGSAATRNYSGRGMRRSPPPPPLPHFLGPQLNLTRNTQATRQACLGTVRITGRICGNQEL